MISFLKSILSKISVKENQKNMIQKINEKAYGYQLSTLTDEKQNKYHKEISNLLSAIAIIEKELFFYPLEGDSSYNGVDISYLSKVKAFPKDSIISEHSGMKASEWEGLKNIEIYNGPYLVLEGFEPDKFRIIVDSINNGEQAGILILFNKQHKLNEELINQIEFIINLD